MLYSSTGIQYYALNTKKKLEINFFYELKYAQV